MPIRFENKAKYPENWKEKFEPLLKELNQ